MAIEIVDLPIKNGDFPIFSIAMAIEIVDLPIQNAKWIKMVDFSSSLCHSLPGRVSRSRSVTLFMGYRMVWFGNPAN